MLANKAETKRRTELTQVRLKQLFNYREDGMLIWRIRTNSSCKAGGVAGYKHSSGYLIAQIAGKNFSLGYHNEFLEAVCHRLAAEQAEGWAGCDSSSPAYKYVQRHANKEAAA